jgi:simple sugar transport system substrate-binding protein
MKKCKNGTLIVFLALAVLVGSPLFATGNSEQESGTEDSLSVLVFIPGVLAGSPPYSSLADGTNAFLARHPDATAKIYEAGFNQAEWEQQLTSLVATGAYDLVLTTNPSMTDLCANVGKKFPDQKFVVTDAYMEGNGQIRTYLYNQYEQSFFLGYLAGLVTTSDMEFANDDLKIGFLAAQEYPLLNNQMLPGFLDGARLVNPDITMDFRVIGNWYDANKAAELASSMVESGVDVFATNSGGADQGLFKVAKEQGAYIVYHNADAYASVPGLVVGCGIMEQQKLAEEILQQATTGQIEYGKASVVGLEEGYIGFVFDNPAYTENLPQSIRDRFESFMEEFEAGTVPVAIPSL